MPTRPFYQLPVAAVLQQLQVRASTGLSAAGAQGRLKAQGNNEIIAAGRRHGVLALFSRLGDIIVLCLVAAAVVSLLLGHIVDAIFIGIAVLFDTLLNTVHLWRARRVLERLREHTKQTVLVLRDSHLIRIPAESLVVGDIIEFRAGERVPADARLIQVSGLRIDESALTGESSEIHKHLAALISRTALPNRTNMAYLGTTVTSGSGRAVVVATGARTEFGQIAQVLKSERSPRSPLHRQLQRDSRLIAVGALGLVLLLAGGSIAVGTAPAAAARIAVTLLVSAIPEDLTLILTVTLAIGMIRIARHRGVLQELGAGETLGSTTVICTDKTGTLTEGKMQAQTFNFLQGTVTHPGEKPGHSLQEMAYISLGLANDAHRAGPTSTQYIGSATERVALEFVEQAGLSQTALRRAWRLRDSISFNPRWKYRAALHDHPKHPTRTLLVNGAPEVLLARSTGALNEQGQRVPLTLDRRTQMVAAIDGEARAGARLLGVAVRPNLTLSSITHDSVADLTFLGVLSVTDPLRAQTAAAIAQAQQAGVVVTMITGDHAATAQAVARQCGLAATVDTLLSGTELETMSDQDLAKHINQITIFARVTALDKQRIIRALRARGHIVAMTGDGVNDAVALKSADIGVAMGSGKDIAKDAADLVLLDNNFATIVASIREGRIIRDNIRKVLAFLLATNTAELALFIVSFISGWPLPLLPAQILWINMVTDGTSDLALALEPAEGNVMKRKPESYEAPLLKPLVRRHIIWPGLVMTVITLGLFWYLAQYLEHDLAYVRTMVFTFLSCASLLSTWSYRSLTEGILRRGLWQNPWLIVSTAFSFALQLAAVYLPPLQALFDTIPLAATDWSLILLLAVLSTIFIDLRKILLPLFASYAHYSPARSQG